MSPPDDVANLIWNTLFEIWMPVVLSLLVYGMLVILVPSVFQFVRFRNLAPAMQDLAKRRSEMA